MVYDSIVIGAGIAGSSVAYFLSEKKERVLVLDRAGIAHTGGSAAAGAFVSPKIGKGSSLQRLTNDAFVFAKDFYLDKFPQHFLQTGVVRIPKDDDDANKFSTYEAYNYPNYQWVKLEALIELGIIDSHDSFLFDEAGVCSPKVCEAMLEGIDFVQTDVKQPLYKDGHWIVDGYQAYKLILATGYESKFFDMRYMGIKGTWGTRGDYKSSLPLSRSMHKSVSVSANVDGIIKIGATHERGKLPCVRCDEESLKELFAKASTMVDTSDFELIATYCGMRSSSHDYFPLVGSVIDVCRVLESNPKLPYGAKLTEPLKYIENLYICNGLGGRGFVFGPMMGKMLADYIVDGKEVDEQVNPDRLFLKWCRKSKDLEERRR